MRRIALDCRGSVDDVGGREEDLEMRINLVWFPDQNVKIVRLVEADANQHYIIPVKIVRLQVCKYVCYR